jgi:hypothetical protein
VQSCVLSRPRTPIFVKHYRPASAALAPPSTQVWPFQTVSTAGTTDSPSFWATLQRFHPTVTDALISLVTRHSFFLSNLKRRGTGYIMFSGSRPTWSSGLCQRYLLRWPAFSHCQHGGCPFLRPLTSDGRGPIEAIVASRSLAGDEAATFAACTSRARLRPSLSELSPPATGWCFIPLSHSVDVPTGGFLLVVLHR